MLQQIPFLFAETADKRDKPALWDRKASQGNISKTILKVKSRTRENSPQLP